MTQLNTDYYTHHIAALSMAYDTLQAQPQGTTLYNIYRAACVKEFEIILEQSGKLLKKCLKPYLASSKEVDSLVFKDIFRVAARHSLIDIEAAQRWMVYRDNNNATAHDYGEGFANETLKLLPSFLSDATALGAVFNQSQ